MKILFAAFAVFLATSTAHAEKLALQVARANAALDQRTTQPVVTVRLTSDSAKVFGEFTQKNVGRRLDVGVNGKVLMSPILREPITGGWLQISGTFSIGEATSIAKELHSGAATLEIEAVPDFTPPR